MAALHPAAKWEKDLPQPRESGKSATRAGHRHLLTLYGHRAAASLASGGHARRGFEQGSMFPAVASFQVRGKEVARSRPEGGIMATEITREIIESYLNC